MSISGTDNKSAVQGSFEGNTAKPAEEQFNSRREQSRDQNEEHNPTGQERKRKAQYVSMHQIGRMNGTPLPMTNTAEALERFRSDFVEAMPKKDPSNTVDVNVFPIDASVSGIPFSMLVVAGVVRGRESIGVAFHTFLLAGSAEKMHPREESYRGQRIFVVQTPGDGYTEKVRQVIRDVLSRHYGDHAKLLSSDAEVIQPDFPSIKDDDSAIADCVKNALASLKTAVDRADPNSVRLCLGEEENRGSYNTIHVQHRQNNIFDRGHQPVRADVIIDLTARERTEYKSRDPLDQLVQGMRISRIGGYYDIVYAPSEAAAARNDLYLNDRDRNRLDRDAFQLYSLRFITTFIDTIDFSIHTMLLAMATANAAGEMSEIMKAFEPNQAFGEEDDRNIGVLAIEPNVQELERGFGTRYETKSQTFTPARLKAFITTVTRPGIIQSIDIPECGASTWQYLDLLAAAEGSGPALKRVFEAACDLTDGHFADLWGPNEPIFDSHVERVHLGHVYDDASGQKIDIRTFDYIMHLNRLDPERIEDLESIQRFGMAASNGDETTLSLSDKYEIIKSFMPHAEVTGYAMRLNFRSAFMSALVEAINRCKTSLTPSSSNRDPSSRYRTTYGNIDNIQNRPGSNGLYTNQRRGRDRDYDDRDYRYSRQTNRY